MASSTASLSDYYARWEAKVKALEREADEIGPPQQHAPSPSLSAAAAAGRAVVQDPNNPLDPSKIKYALGKPLTEEEFREYQRTAAGASAKVVGSACI